MKELATLVRENSVIVALGAIGIVGAMVTRPPSDRSHSRAAGDTLSFLLLPYTALLHLLVAVGTNSAVVAYAERQAVRLPRQMDERVMDFWTGGASQLSAYAPVGLPASAAVVVSPAHHAPAATHHYPGSAYAWSQAPAAPLHEANAAGGIDEYALSFWTQHLRA